MSKIRFIVNNYIDNAALSADPVMDTNLPIDNVTDSSRSKVTRSIDNSNQTIRGSFASIKDVSAIVIGRHNFVIDMQYKIFLYNNATLDTTYINTGGTESTNDDFYIAGNHAGTYTAGVEFDVIGDTANVYLCTGGSNNNFPAQDWLQVDGNFVSSFPVGSKFNYTGDTNSTSNRTYTVVSTILLTLPDRTAITVEEEVGGAIFNGTLAPYARYTVNTGGAIVNTTTYAVTGGIDNTGINSDIFYVTGDQSAIFNRATLVSMAGNSNSASNITYTIFNVTYNAGATRTEITVEEDINGHDLIDPGMGTLLPIYTTIPVVTNTITTPNFDGTLLPDFLVWDSGILNVTTDTVGSSLWEWGSFLWGAEAWGSDRVSEEFSPPSNIVEWIPTVQTQIRGFKIELFAAGGTISYFEIGRLFIGKYIQPTYNIGYGHSLTWQESTKQYRTDAGSLRSDISIPFRKFEFNLGTITESDRVLLQHELRNVGLRKDLFVSLFPEDASNNKKLDYSGIVKMTKVPKFTEFAQNYYKAKYIMEEV